MQKIYHKRNELLEVEFFKDKECTKAFESMSHLYYYMHDMDVEAILKAVQELDAIFIIPYISKTQMPILSSGIRIERLENNSNSHFWTLSETERYNERHFQRLLPNLSKYIPEDNAVLFLSEEDCNQYKYLKTNTYIIDSLIKHCVIEHNSATVGHYYARRLAEGKMDKKSGFSDWNAKVTYFKNQRDCLNYINELYNTKTHKNIKYNCNVGRYQDGITLIFDPENNYNFSYGGRNPAVDYERYHALSEDKITKLTIFLSHGTKAELKKVNQVAKELKEKYGVEEVNVFVLHCFVSDIYNYNSSFLDDFYKQNFQDAYDELCSIECKPNISKKEYKIQFEKDKLNHKQECYINKIITTNSTGLLKPQDNEKLQVIDCFDIFNDAL